MVKLVTFTVEVISGHRRSLEVIKVHYEDKKVPPSFMYVMNGLLAFI